MAQSKVGTVNTRPVKTKLFAPAGAPPLKKPAARKVVKKPLSTINELRAEARRLSNKAYRARKKTEALNKLDDGSNAFDTKTGKPVRLVVRGKNFKPAVRNPSHLLNGNRYPIHPLPSGKHEGVEVRVIGEGPYPNIFYKTKDGSIFFNGRRETDLITDKQFGPKEISAIYQLGGPAPKVVKAARTKYVQDRLYADAERMQPQLVAAARTLGYTHFLTKSGKKVSIPKAKRASFGEI